MRAGNQTEIRDALMQEGYLCEKSTEKKPEKPSPRGVTASRLSRLSRRGVGGTVEQSLGMLDQDLDDLGFRTHVAELAGGDARSKNSGCRGARAQM